MVRYLDTEKFLAELDEIADEPTIEDVAQFILDFKGEPPPDYYLQTVIDWVERNFPGTKVTCKPSPSQTKQAMQIMDVMVKEYGLSSKEAARRLNPYWGFFIKRSSLVRSYKRYRKSHAGDS